MVIFENKAKNSQGGAIGLIALQKQRNEKLVKNFFGLAPATYISHARAPMLLALSRIFGHIRDVFGDREFGTLIGSYILKFIFR